MKEWKDNKVNSIMNESGGKTLIIRFNSRNKGISHTDVDMGIDYTVDITWVRGQDYIRATTGKYHDDDIHSWKEI